VLASNIMERLARQMARGKWGGIRNDMGHLPLQSVAHNVSGQPSHLRAEESTIRKAFGAQRVRLSGHLCP